jgi:hypothetical protein
MSRIESKIELMANSKEGNMRASVFHRWKIMALVVGLLALTACAGTTKGYSGPALPADQTSVVRSGPYTDLVATDGVRVSGLSVALLPGKHTIEFKPSDNQQTYGYGAYYFYSRVTGSIAVMAEAGRTYLAYVRIETAPATTDDSSAGYAVDGSTDTGFTWSGYITDEATGQILGRTDRLPLQAEPRNYSYGALPPMMRR